VEMNFEGESEILPHGVTLEDVSTFQFMYLEHCKVIITNGRVS
jgi:hypothetical protein